MDKWEKAIFWIIAEIIIVLLIGLFFKADFKGLIFIIILLAILIILDTATQEMKSKWKAFGIRALLIFFIAIILGSIFGISDYGIGQLFSLLIILDLIQTATKKKKKTK